MHAHIIPLLLPRWGIDMAEGKVVRWLAAEGEAVQPGTELVEIESEKTVAAIEADTRAVLRRRIAREGDLVPVGALLGVLAPDGVTNADIDTFVRTFDVAGRSSRDTQVQEQTIDVLGHPLRVLALGSGELPVLLVHGFGGDRRSWGPVQTELARQRRVISVDLPGHGDSGKALHAADPAFFRAVLVALLDALALARVHLVGHSWGGELALAVATQAPDRVASLTLIGTAGPATVVDHGYVRAFLDASRRTEVKAVLQRLFADPARVTREMVERTLRYKRIEAVGAVLERIAAAAQAGRPDVDPTVTAAIPTLILAGREDRICPLGEDFAPPAGVAVHRLERVGHMPHIESPAEVTSLIQAHLAGIEHERRDRSPPVSGTTGSPPHP